jgi:hypothetical protein
LIPSFCRSLTKTGEILLELIGAVTLTIVKDLQVLTLGAQFRGSGNVKVKQNAIDSFFSLMKVLLAGYNPKVKGRRTYRTYGTVLAKPKRATRRPRGKASIQRAVDRDQSRFELRSEHAQEGAGTIRLHYAVLFPRPDCGLHDAGGDEFPAGARFHDGCEAGAVTMPQSPFR